MHPAELAQLDMLRALRAQVESCAHGQSSKLLQQAAGQLGVSLQTVCNRLKGVGYQSGRKLRKDKSGSAVNLIELMNVAALRETATRRNGKRNGTSKDAISEARANGMLIAPVSDRQITRLLRINGLDAESLDAPAPHTTLRSRHPNHVWELDASICVLYYLRGKEGLRVMDVREFNKNKPKALERIVNERVLRYAVTDHTTGAVFCQYFLTPGESQEVLFEFLMLAMHPRENDVMHGCPYIIYWDLGSANTSHAVGVLFDRLGIKAIAHKRGNARAKGQVEGVHNIIERNFESRLARKPIHTLEELNQHLQLWLRVKNGVDIHSRHGHTRWAKWQMIQQDELRLCPPVEDCKRMMYSAPDTRVVTGNLTISFKVRGFDSMIYNVEDVPNLRSGTKVEVFANVYDAPQIFVKAPNADGIQQFYACPPIGKDVNGFLVNSAMIGEEFKSHADTAVDKKRKALYELTWGTTDTDAIEKLKRRGVQPFGLGHDSMADLKAKQATIPAFMSRKGTELHVQSDRVDTVTLLTLPEIMRAIRAELGRGLSAAENTYLNAQHSAGIAPEQLPDVIAALTQPQPAERPRLALVR